MKKLASIGRKESEIHRNRLGLLRAADVVVSLFVYGEL